MDMNFSNFIITYFRIRVLAWLLIISFSFSFVPIVSLAKQPTAKISTLSGTVLVNGKEQGKGTALKTEDIIETKAGASVVLKFSDGSLLELVENTKIDLTELSKTTTGARITRVKLWWGRIRVKLSSDHQQEGAIFDIETPNALVGVTFSQPDVEISYDLASQETVALSLTVALAVKNLVTDEEKIIPIGTTAIITAMGIKVIAGAAATGTIATGTSTATKIAIGAGVLTAAGGVAAVAPGGGGGGNTADVTGTWSGSGTGTVIYEPGGDREPQDLTVTYVLTQSGSSVTGTYTDVDNATGDVETGSLSGSISGSTLTLAISNSDPSDPDCVNFNVTATFSVSGNTMTGKATGTVCYDASKYTGASLEFSITLTKQ